MNQLSFWVAVLGFLLISVEGVVWGLIAMYSRSGVSGWNIGIPPFFLKVWLGKTRFHLGPLPVLGILPQPVILVAGANKNPVKTNPGLYLLLGTSAIMITSIVFAACIFVYTDLQTLAIRFFEGVFLSFAPSGFSKMVVQFQEIIPTPVLALFLVTINLLFLTMPSLLLKLLADFIDSQQVKMLVMLFGMLTGLLFVSLTVIFEIRSLLAASQLIACLAAFTTANLILLLAASIFLKLAGKRITEKA